MKIFHKEENGKEVVFVQEKDVFYFIRENRKIPSIILEEYYKDGVKPVDADLSEFIKLDSEEAVRFFKEKDYIIVDDIKYTKVDEKKTKDNIKIIYYDNGYAEIIYNNLNVMVKSSEHIRYNDNIFEIIDNDKKDVIEIKDIMDIKDIKLENKNNTVSNYMIVLEESNNYDKYNISKKLPSKYINYNI